MKWPHLNHLQLLSRAASRLTVVAEMEVSLRDKMANAQGVKVFTVERHGLLENFESFRNLCGVQSSPLAFSLNCTFVCDPLQGQAPKETLCFRSALS